MNHFEAGADDFTYGGGVEPTGRAPFGSSGARFVESSVVHAGLIDGYTATEIARGIKPGRLVSSNATSASNPLATSAYQVRMLLLLLLLLGVGLPPCIVISLKRLGGFPALLPDPCTLSFPCNNRVDNHPTFHAHPRTHP